MITFFYNAFVRRLFGVCLLLCLSLFMKQMSVCLSLKPSCSVKDNLSFQIVEHDVVGILLFSGSTTGSVGRLCDTVMSDRVI